MGKLWFRRTDLFIPFGSKSGKKLQGLGFQCWPWPLAEWLSCQASNVCDAASASRQPGWGLWAGTASNTTHSPLPAPSAEREKETKLSQPADVWCRISSLALFCYFLKVSSGTIPKCAGLREPRATAASSLPWEHLFPSLVSREASLQLPALCSVSPGPVLPSNEMLWLVLL